MNDMLIFGHRGAAGLEPENTLRSIEAGIRAGADFVEIDIYAVGGKLLVIHDDRLERTTNGSGHVVEQSIDYLRSLDAGKGEKIPFLDEVLEEVAGRAGINVELKGPGTAEPLAALIRKIMPSSGSGLAAQLLISSFNHHELKKFAEMMPALRIGALTSSLPLDYAGFAEALGAFSVHPAMDFLDAEFVSDAHQRGLKVYTYTVNHAEDFERVRKLGVDGVFTDYPPAGIMV